MFDEDIWSVNNSFLSLYNIPSYNDTDWQTSTKISFDKAVSLQNGTFKVPFARSRLKDKGRTSQETVCQRRNNRKIVLETSWRGVRQTIYRNNCSQRRSHKKALLSRRWDLPSGRFVFINWNLATNLRVISQKKSRIACFTDTLTDYAAFFRHLRCSGICNCENVGSLAQTQLKLGKRYR